MTSPAKGLPGRLGELALDIARGAPSGLEVKRFAMKLRVPSYSFPKAPVR